MFLKRNDSVKETPKLLAIALGIYTGIENVLKLHLI